MRNWNTPPPSVPVKGWMLELLQQEQFPQGRVTFQLEDEGDLERRFECLGNLADYDYEFQIVLKIKEGYEMGSEHTEHFRDG